MRKLYAYTDYLQLMGGGDNGRSLKNAQENVELGHRKELGHASTPNMAENRAVAAKPIIGNVLSAPAQVSVIPNNT